MSNFDISIFENRRLARDKVRLLDRIISTLQGTKYLPYLNSPEPFLDPALLRSLTSQPMTEALLLIPWRSANLFLFVQPELFRLGWVVHDGGERRRLSGGVGHGGYGDCGSGLFNGVNDRPQKVEPELAPPYGYGLLLGVFCIRESRWFTYICTDYRVLE